CPRADAEAEGEAPGVDPAPGWPPCPLASRSACWASWLRAASRPLMAEAISLSLATTRSRESRRDAWSSRADAAPAVSPEARELDAFSRDCRLAGSWVRWAAWARARASSARSAGDRLGRRPARSRSAWAPLAGLDD